MAPKKRKSRGGSARPGGAPRPGGPRATPAAARGGRTATPPPAKAGRSGAPLPLIISVALVGAAVVGLVVYLLFLRQEAPLTAQGSASSLPEGGGVVVTEAADVPQVHLYADYQCPVCARLELTSGPEIFEAAEQGRIALTVTTMSFLDQRRDGDVSARVANAAQCADDQGAFAAFYPLPFQWSAAELEQGSPAWTDEQLIDLGEAAGIGDADAFAACVTQGEYLPYVADQQERARRDGVDGTPTIIVDGEQLDSAEMSRLLAGPGGVAEVLGLSE